MPKIKSPVSQQERDYNKRYEVTTQKLYLTALTRPNVTKNWDDYKRGFLKSVYLTLGLDMPLTEKQADFLATLYDQYSE